MIDFQVRPKPALTFEGESTVLLQALVSKEPVHWITTGGGMGGATSVSLAAALESHKLTTIFSGNPVSVGVVNQMLAAYGRATDLAQCYQTVFCSPRFIKPGVRAYLECEKVLINYYGSVLRYKLRGAEPAHAGSTIRIGLTNYETGKPVTVAPDLHNVGRVVRLAQASACIPAICKGKGYKVIDGVPYTDGGISQPIPLVDALQQKPKHLLILMSTPESASDSVIGRWVEQKFADSKMAHLPASTRDALLARHDVFCETLSTIRSQLALPLGHVDRYLPPTSIVWPAAHVGLSMVEQDQTRVQHSLGSVFQEWWKLLNNEKIRCAA
jgi:hypothetical protein